MNKKWVLQNKIIKQVLYIGILPLAFYLSAWQYLKDNYESTPIIIPIIYILRLLWIILFALHIGHMFRNRKERVFRNAIYTYRYGIALFFILLIFAFPRIFILPRWDNLGYYTEIVKHCNRFDFTFRGLVDGSKLFNHTCQGYFCFLSIGVFLFNNPLIGVEFMQMVLYIISTLCYYGILRCLFLNAGEKIRFLGTLIYAFSPFVFGIESNISCDTAILFYLVILIYVALKGYTLLEVVVAILLILSKEPGVLYYVAFYGIWFLVKVIRSIKYERKLKWQDIKWIMIRMIPGIVGILVILIWSSSNPLSWMNGMRQVRLNLADKSVQSQAAQSNIVTEGFGFNGEYSIIKLKQLFLLNFIWINWLILLCGCIYSINSAVRKKEKKEKINGSVWALVGVEIVHIAFNLLFITYAVPRYVNVNSMFAALGAFWALNRVLTDGKWKTGILSSLTALMIISCFYSLDPISFWVFESVKVGSDSYMYVPIYENYSAMRPADLYSDHTVYNCQNDYFTLLEEKVLRTIQYDGTIPLMEIDINEGQWDDPWQYDYIYMQLEGLYGRTTCYWDPDRGKFSETFSKKDTDLPMNVVYFNSEQFYNGGNGYRDMPLPDVAYVLLHPRQDIESILEAVKIRYDIQETYEVSLHGMSIYTYKVEKLR